MESELDCESIVAYHWIYNSYHSHHARYTENRNGTHYQFISCVKNSPFDFPPIKWNTLVGAIIARSIIRHKFVRVKRASMARYLTAAFLLQIGTLVLVLSCTTNCLSLEDQVQQLTENYVRIYNFISFYSLRG